MTTYLDCDELERAVDLVKILLSPTQLKTITPQLDAAVAFCRAAPFKMQYQKASDQRGACDGGTVPCYSAFLQQGVNG